MASTPSTTVTTSVPEPRSEELAVVAAYTSAFDLELLPTSADLCIAWFGSWSQDYLRVEVAAVESGDQALIDAVAGHQAAAGSAVADCIEGRPVDDEELAAQQTALEGVLP